MTGRSTSKHSHFTNLDGIGSSAHVAEDADFISLDTISEVRDWNSVNDVVLVGDELFVTGSM